MGIDNLSRWGAETNVPDLVRRGVLVIRGDIRSRHEVTALPPADWVIDCAACASVLGGITPAMGPAELLEHNLFGTLNTLEYCRINRAGLILMSTSRVYSINSISSIRLEAAGGAFRPMESQDWPRGVSAMGISESCESSPPLSLYGASKLASETVALEYGEAFGFSVWINRCGVLAGAGQFGRSDQGIVSYWLNSWLRGRPMKFSGFGGCGFQVRDILHPADLVPVLIRQMGCGRTGMSRVSNFGGGVRGSLSLREISDWCMARWGDREIVADPVKRRFDLPWVVMDCRQAQAVWGWKPRIGPIEILEDVARHAEAHPAWLEISGAGGGS